MTGQKIAVLRKCQVQDVTRTSFRVRPEPQRQKHPLGTVYRDAFGERFVVRDDR